MYERVETIVQWCIGLPPRFYNQHFVVVSYFHTILCMLYPTLSYSINIPYIYDSFQRKLQMSVIFTPKSLGLQGDQTSQFLRKSVLNVHWKDWCWRWNCSTLATWCKELTPWKRPWCRARLKAGGEGDDRWWDGWMASPTRWTRVWAGSRRWRWTGKPGVLQSTRLQSQTRLSNWTEPISSVWFQLPYLNFSKFFFFYFCKNQFFDELPLHYGFYFSISLLVLFRLFYWLFWGWFLKFEFIFWYIHFLLNYL